MMLKLGDFIIKSYSHHIRQYQIARTFSSSENPFTKKYATPEEEARKDVQTALEIGSSLFENSMKTHKPVTASDRRPSRNVSKKDSTTPTWLNAQPTNSRPNKNLLSYEPSVIKDDSLGLSYTKLKLNDPFFKNLLTITRSRKRRDKNRQIIVEGRRLILEALAANIRLQTIVFSQKDQLALLSKDLQPLRSKIDIYKVPQHDLKTWSTLTTPPGLLAIFERPLDSDLQLPKKTEQFPITVVCDNIREPNNLGGIIRACAAIPCQQVIVLKGCCDPWETKSLRGGCGAQFRLQIRDNIDWEDISKYLPDKFSTFAAENNLEKVKKYKFTNPSENLVKSYLDIGNNAQHYVIIIGGETHGISDTAYDFVDSLGKNGSFVHIPLAAGIESLNTSCALSLILFEIRRQALQQNINVENQNKYTNVT